MGVFSNNSITDVGRMMLADVQAGAVFTPTRIVIGSGSMPGGATAQGMTDVITPVISLAINKKQRTPDGKCIFGGVYSNADVTTAFYFRELALYAKAVYLNADGTVRSEGEETLYGYGNAGSTADFMPAYATNAVVEKQIDLVTWVGNDAQVDLTIETGIYLSQKQGVRNIQYINPDTTGFVSLLEYMASIYDDNIIVSGHISGFSDMPDGVAVLHGTVNVVGEQMTVSGTAFYYRGTSSLTQWTDAWRKVYDANNKPTPAELGAAPAVYVTKAYQTYSDAEIDAAMLDAYARTADNAIGYFVLYANLGTLIMPGGVWHITVYRRTAEYGMFEANSYDINGTRTMARSLYEGKLLPIAWDNPPLREGIEYRTTERRGGSAVYKKLDTDGLLKYRLEGDTVWNIYAQENAVKKTGDTMTEDLTISKAASPSLRLNATGNGAGAVVQMGVNQLLLASRNQSNNIDNSRILTVNNSTRDPDVAKAVRLIDKINGVESYYELLHTGNLHLYGLAAVEAGVE